MPVIDQMTVIECRLNYLAWINWCNINDNECVIDKPKF